VAEALDKLGINLGLLIAYTANVLLLIIILRAAAYKPILDMMQKRRERIAEGLNTAREAEEARANAEAEREAILTEARAEAQKIVAEARMRADEQAKQILSDASDDARRTRQRAQEEAAAEREQQLANMRDQIISLSIAAAGHLIGTSVDEKKGKDSVNAFFAELPAEAKGLGDFYTIVTAVPLTETEKKNIVKKLGVDAIEFVTDPSILGGVIVRSGAREIDASYANQLAELRSSMLAS